jgi:glucose/arabinose dehydrogenase
VRRWWYAALLAALVLAGCGGDGKTGAGKTYHPVPPLAADGPPCRFVDWIPFHNIRTTCIEVVYDNVTPPEAVPALSGLAFAPDGALYFARTALGEIWAIPDPDTFEEAPLRVAEGLNLPVGIAVHDGALYVTTLDGVQRLDDADADGVFEAHTILIDPPIGAPFWPGSVGIGPDGRLYVSTGAGCETCEGATQESGGVLSSYALDGSDARLEASGFRSPADFAWQPDTGDLWIVDSGRVIQPGSPDSPPDELNRVQTGADYGFPFCTGQQQPDAAFVLPDPGYCASTTAPDLAFPPQSSPAGLAFYGDDAFPFFEGDLIVTLGGSWNLPEPAGYALVEVGFDGAQPDGRVTQIAPAHPTTDAPISLAAYSLTNKGFFPYHPADVVVSAHGWIYVSLAEGRIYRFRPRPAATEPASGTG